MEISVEEAAQRLGISAATVKRRLSNSQLDGKKVGKTWVVDDGKLPAPRRKAAAVVTAARYDVKTALAYVTRTDVNELWVPDVLSWADVITDPDALLDEAQHRLDSVSCNGAEQIEVPKTSMLTRPAVLLTMEDRVAYQAVVSQVLPLTDATLSPRIYSARANPGPPFMFKKSTKQWVAFHKRVAKEIKAGAAWVAQTDVTAYFESIDHTILFKDLAAVGVPQRDIEQLRSHLSTWSRTPGRGLPQGPNASRALGNFYMGPVDDEMINAGYNYWRYMDDVMIVAANKAEAMAGMRLFEKACRERGLIVSAHKTKLVTGTEAATAGGDPIRDGAEYLLESGQTTQATKVLRQILEDALSQDGSVDTGKATFALWRLAKQMDKRRLPLVLKRLHDLGPVARVSASFLRMFVSTAAVETALSEFVVDPERNTSPITESWLFASMLEHPASLPPTWVDHARDIARDRNARPYHRALASNVMALGQKATDISWMKAELRQEHDPELMRAYLVALKRAGELDKGTMVAAANRSAALVRTTNYLHNRQTLPSLVWRGQEVRVK